MSNNNSETRIERFGGVIEFVVVLVICFIFLAGIQNIKNSSFLLREMVFLSAPYTDTKGIAKALVFAVSYAFGAVFLYLVLKQKSSRVFVVLTACVAITIFIDIFIQAIGSPAGFTAFQYIVALNEYGNSRNLLIFRSQASSALLYMAFYLLLMLVLRRNVSPRMGKKWLFLLPLCFVPVVVAKAAVYYIALSSYPSFIKIPLIAGQYHIDYKEQKPRVLAPEILPDVKRRKNIIYVIDESIGGQYLSANGFYKDTTPDIKKLIKSGDIENYGVVPSVGNCSATSNLLLRIGLSPFTIGVNNDFVGSRRTLPTIFQFAKRAGYKTWLFDSQNRTDKGALQNYLTYDDLTYIDQYSSHPARTEESKRDFLALEKIVSSVKNDDDSYNFVVLVKDGAHWPYLWRYPADESIFLPVQESEYEPMISANRSKIINTYSNLMKHTVNDFLAKYVDYHIGNDTILFYTSDHGQALVEPDAKDGLTHCSSFHDPHSSQAAVPLMVIDSSDKKRYLPMRDKKYFQSQIFPSILNEMGYRGNVQERYGMNLSSGYASDTDYWFYWSVEGDKSLYKSSQVKTSEFK